MYFHFLMIFFFKDFIYLFLERREERGRETLMCEKNIYQWPLAHPQLETGPVTQACALTGNRTSDLSDQSTEPHQPGHFLMIFLITFYFL